jgi:hypothetical protein
MIERHQSDLARCFWVFDEFAEIAFDGFGRTSFSSVASPNFYLLGRGTFCQATSTFQKTGQCFRANVGNGTCLTFYFSIDKYDLAAMFSNPDMYLIGLLVELICQNSANFRDRHAVYPQAQSIS